MKIRHALPVIVASLLMQSCVYDSIKPCNGEYYGELQIVNDWRYAPSADPAGMAYLFFSPEYTDPWRFDIAGLDGGIIKIPTGSYRMIAFNDDTSRINFLKEDSFQDFALSTFPTSIYPGVQAGMLPDGLPEEIKGEDVLLTPDPVWGTAIGNVAIENIKNNGILYVYPRQLTRNYHIEIRNARNVESLKSIYGALSGMAYSVNIDGDPSHTAAVNPFDLSYDKNGGIMFSDFHTFGRPADSGKRNYLFLFATLTDGKRTLFEFDVTDKILNSPDSFNVKIVIEGLEIPEAGDPEGTFEVNVDGWNIIRIDISG